jgi:hypothetical protein
LDLRYEDHSPGLPAGLSRYVVRGADRRYDPAVGTSIIFTGGKRVTCTPSGCITEALTSELNQAADFTFDNVLRPYTGFMSALVGATDVQPAPARTIAGVASTCQVMTIVYQQLRTTVCTANDGGYLTFDENANIRDVLLSVSHDVPDSLFQPQG